MQHNFELKLRDMNEEISKRLDAFIKLGSRKPRSL